MKKETFISHLQSATEATLDFTRGYVTNTLADAVIYQIRPNQTSLSAHLDDEELENLKVRKTELDQDYSLEEVLERLYINGKVPVWINLYVIAATKQLTTVELFTSRRFRGEEELYHQEAEMPPFHPQVATPFYFAELKEGQKFNVNWRKQKLKNWFMSKYLIWKWGRKLKKENAEKAETLGFDPETEVIKDPENLPESIEAENGETVFGVFMHGRNFLMEYNGSLERIGFYTSRFVPAESKEAAAEIAIKMVREDGKLEENVRNLWSDPPILEVEEVTIAGTESLQKQPEFTFYDDSAEG